MIFQQLKTGVEVSDRDFDSIYARRIRAVSKIHFTPVKVARTAARFLVNAPGTRVLDVGSGAGKFCMVGAACTGGVFTGVEQRAYLHQLSDLLSRFHSLSNTQFIHSNITNIPFREYDAIYFFNSFYENMLPDAPIDRSVLPDRALYAVYSQYMKDQLSTMPAGTRLATYFSYMDEIPACYTIQASFFDDKLKLWIKTA